jgi:putative membrane protein
VPESRHRRPGPVGHAGPYLLMAGWLALALLASHAATHHLGLGILAGTMAGHILLMNVAAPGLVLLLRAVTRISITPPGRPFAAATAQLALLWAWHTPFGYGLAYDSSAVHLLMSVTLGAAAVWYWLEVLSSRDGQSWRPLLSLLATGKIFCLLGGLITFAPRLLLGPLAVGDGHSAASLAAALEDQQLAGLLMLAACPATYVLAGVVVTARWLRALEAMDGNGPTSPGRVPIPVRSLRS